MGERELAKALRELSARRYLSPGSKVTRTARGADLQRWYDRYRARRLEGRRPTTRKTGNAQSLSVAR